MTIHYSSLFLKDKIESASQLSTIDNCLLVLDTNICIYLRDFYQSPIKFIKSNPYIWTELRDFLLTVIQHHFEVNIGLGIDEACRSMDTFEIIPKKRNQMILHVTKVLEMDYQELLEYTTMLVFHTPIKDNTSKSQTKIVSALQESAFNNLCVFHYACMLKAYLLDLDVQTNSLSRVEAMFEYLRFMDKEIDLISSAALSFGVHYFGGNPDVRKLLIKKGKNSRQVEGIIHNIWNASLDLCFPIIVSNYFDLNKYIPIFVTHDDALSVIFNSLKMSVVFTESNKLTNIPNMIEINYAESFWDTGDLFVFGK